MARKDLDKAKLKLEQEIARNFSFPGQTQSERMALVQQCEVEIPAEPKIEWPSFLNLRQWQKTALMNHGIDVGAEPFKKTEPAPPPAHPWREHRIFTEDWQAATVSVTRDRQMREWAEIEEEAEFPEAERIRYCIWCGKLCDTLEDLDIHEAECE